MDTEYLREFIALAGRLNYTLAANDLHVSQPSLSRHMAELEKHFGVPLLSKENGLALTYAGETLLNEASTMLRCEDHLERSVQESRNIVPVVFKIEDWRYSHTTMDIVRRTLNRIVKLKAGYRIRFIPVIFGMGLLDSVKDGSLDLGILAHTSAGEPVFEHDDDIAIIDLPETRAPLQFFVDQDNPLANRSSLSFSDIKDTPITVPLNPECVNIRADLTRICNGFGYTPTFYATKLDSMDDIFCLDLKGSLLIGIEEYLSRGFTNSDHTRMIPCSDDVTVTTYLFYRKSSENEILWAFLDELPSVRGTDDGHAGD